MLPIVLIAGPSGSGKSTLAQMVAAKLGFPCLSLDDFFIRGAKAYVDTPQGKVRTFERPELYDGGRLAAQIANRTSGLVADGFCLFAYAQVLDLPARRFYLDVPFPVCAARRAARKPQRLSDKSFALIGEAETARYILPQRSLPGGYRGDIPPRRKAVVPVGSLAEASRVCTAFIDKYGLGGGNWTGGDVRDNGKVIARISSILRLLEGRERFRSESLFRLGTPPLLRRSGVG